MAVVRIPDDLLERILPQLRSHKKRLGRHIAISAKKGRPHGTVEADRRRLRDMDKFTELLEAASPDR